MQKAKINNNNKVLIREIGILNFSWDSRYHHHKIMKSLRERYKSVEMLEDHSILARFLIIDFRRYWSRGRSILRIWEGYFLINPVYFCLRILCWLKYHWIKRGKVHSSRVTYSLKCKRDSKAWQKSNLEANLTIIIPGMQLLLLNNNLRL